MKNALSDWAWYQKVKGGMFSRKLRAENLQTGLEFDNFKPCLESGTVNWISWSNCSLFRGDDSDLWQRESRPFQWQEFRLLTCELLPVCTSIFYACSSFRKWQSLPLNNKPSIQKNAFEIKISQAMVLYCPFLNGVAAFQTLKNQRPPTAYLRSVTFKSLNRLLCANSKAINSSLIILWYINIQKGTSTLRSTRQAMFGAWCLFTSLRHWSSSCTLLRNKPRFSSRLVRAFKTGGALCGAGDGQQLADDSSHGVGESVRTAGLGSWDAPCGCGPASTFDLTHGLCHPRVQITRFEICHVWALKYCEIMRIPFLFVVREFSKINSV